LKPLSPATYTAMGFVNAIMGKLDEAITYFHKSLAINHDCIFTTTILKTCIEDLMESDDMINLICGADIKVTKQRAAERVVTAEDTQKFNCMKLKFDEEEQASTSDVAMDISAETT